MRVGSRNHAVSGALEEHARELPDGRFVFDDQNCFRAPERARRRLDGGERLRRFVGDGQIHLERCPVPELAVNPDVPATLLDDAVHRREPQASTLAPFFGREERLEQTASGGFVDSGARVADGQHHVGSRANGDMALRVRLVERDIGRLDGQQTASRHRIAPVHHQVHDHLFDLRRIGPHRRKTRRRHGSKLDVLSDHAAQHLREIADDGVEVDGNRLHHLLAPERQELPRERGRALGRFDDLVEIGP